MVIFTKDRNIITFRSDHSTHPRSYVFDINTGIVTGLSNKPLQSIPKILSNETLADNPPLNLVYLGRLSYTREVNLAVARLLDRFESIGYRHNPCNLSRYVERNVQTVEDNFKKFAKSYADNNTLDFCEWCQNNAKYEWLKKNHLDYDDAHSNRNILDYLYVNAVAFDTPEKVKWANYYLHRGLYEFCQHVNYRNYARLICRYFELVELLNETPQKGDFMRLFVEADRKYKLRKEELDNTAISSHQAKKLNALSFSNDEFSVVVPMTAQEIIAEGEAQNNCVGRLYLPMVVSHDTHIVFIRKNDSLDKSYITCEVNNKGCIMQYLKKYNHWVATDTPEAAFREAYQEHLFANWGKGD